MISTKCCVVYIKFVLYAIVAYCPNSVLHRYLKRGGWAILGGMAAGSVSSILFDLAYQNNLSGLQDGLDWAGNKIDEGVDYAKQKSDDVREATIDVGAAINPMNWVW